MPLAHSVQDRLFWLEPQREVSAINPRPINAMVTSIAIELRATYPEFSDDEVYGVVLQAAIELIGATSNTTLPIVIRRRASARLAARSGYPTPIRSRPKADV